MDENRVLGERFAVSVVILPQKLPGLVQLNLSITIPMGDQHFWAILDRWLLYLGNLYNWARGCGHIIAAGAFSSDH